MSLSIDIGPSTPALPTTTIGGALDLAAGVHRRSARHMVIRGGENVYPREIEEFLITHPDVVDVQVVGVADPTFGEELREWCRGKLAHYKVPRYVRLTDEFPMTVTGKVQKFKMRETSIDELSLQPPS